MPIYIAHRGNTSGKDVENENKPEYLDKALDMGFDVELDLRIKEDGTFWLGHDEPQYEIKSDWIKSRQEFLWVHCKNLLAFKWAVTNQIPHAFFHDQDDFTLTTCRKIWTYPGKPVTLISILVVLDEKVTPVKHYQAYGYCADDFQV